jgi:hypothetical protein
LFLLRERPPSRWAFLRGERDLVAVAVVVVCADGL